jgi:c-di-GMP-binding flagellar brake protein YcgR
MTNGADKRQHPRYAIELDAEITVGDVVAAGRTHDISKGGFSMLAKKAVPVHAPGQVKLALVFSENEFSEQLVLPATAMWCTPIKNAYQIGVKFVMLDPQNRGYLDLFIKFLDGGDEVDDSTESE